MQSWVLLYVNYLYHHHHHLGAHLGSRQRHIQSACYDWSVFSPAEFSPGPCLATVALCGVWWWCVVCGHRDQHRWGDGGMVNLVCRTFTSVTREFWLFLSRVLISFVPLFILKSIWRPTYLSCHQILTQRLTVKKSFRLGKSLWSRVEQKLKYFVRSLKMCSYICKSVRAFSGGRGPGEMLIKPPVLLRDSSALTSQPVRPAPG